MTIAKVDGQLHLDSGSVIVAGDAVVEVRFEAEGQTQQVAIKFRSDGGEMQIRYGSPHEGRIVVHLANFPPDNVVSDGGFYIGQLGESPVYLAFVVEPFRHGDRGLVRAIRYTLFLRKPK